MAFLRARGWTLMENDTPFADSETGIIRALAGRPGVEFQRQPCPGARRSILLQSPLQSRATCPWKAPPSVRRAACGLRFGRAGRAADENTAERLPGFP